LLLLKVYQFHKDPPILLVNAIEEKEVLPFIQISKNSFIDMIGFQNKGYALMTFK
jgi:hypothetical protein